MQIENENSGKPSGRPRYERKLSNILRERLAKGRTAQELVDVLVRVALAGDLKAIEIVLGRLEPKPLISPLTMEDVRRNLEPLSAKYGLSPDEIIEGTKDLFRIFND